MIEKRNGVIMIDGTPVQDVGRLVARKGVVGAARTKANEWGFCVNCKREKPMSEFRGTVAMDARGYKGWCSTCATKRTDK
jgi:hypothetical protein